jgi:hypothetical protein
VPQAGIGRPTHHYAHVLNDDVRQAKAEGAEGALPALQKF